MSAKISRKIIVFVCLAAALCSAPQAFAAFPFFEKETEQSLFDRAKKAYDDGFYDVAAGQFARFGKKYPASKMSDDATILLGSACLFLSRYDDGLKCFQKVIDRGGSLKEKAMFLRGEAYYKKGDFQQALECIDLLTGEFPETQYRAAARYTAGKANYHMGRFDRALELFDGLAKESADPAVSIDARIAAARTYIALGEPQKGLTLLQALRKGPLPPERQAEVGYWTGIIQSRLGLYKDAAASFGEQIKLNPAGPYAAESLFRQAQINIELRLYDSADEALRRIIEKHPKSEFAVPARLLKAKILILKGAYDDAMAYIEKNFVKKFGEPYDTTARLLSAYTRLHAGEYKQAFEKFNKIAAQSKDDSLKAEAYAGMGEALFMQTKFIDAAGYFEKAYRTDKDPLRQAQAQARWGDALFVLEDFSGALEKYEDVLSRYPQYLQKEQRGRLHLQAGLALDKLDDPRRAIESYRKVRDEAPLSTSVRESLYREGLALCSLGRYDEAVNVLSGLFKEKVPDGLRDKALLKTAQAYFNLRQYALSAQTYARLVEEGTDKDLIRKGMFELGWAFSLSGNAEEALKVFNKFIKRYPTAPEAPEAYFWLGEYYYNGGGFQDAQKMFDALVSLYPKSDMADDALFWASRCANRMGNNGEAVWLLKRLNNEYPESTLRPDALFCLGDTYAAMRRFRPAMKYFQKVLREYRGSPLSFDAFGRIGDMSISLGKYKKGLRAFSRVLSSPDVKSRAQAIFKMGICYAALGENAQAQEQFLKVVYDFPEEQYWFSKAAFKAAVAYEAAGDWQSALRLYRKVADARADRHEDARERIEMIKKEHGEALDQ